MTRYVAGRVATAIGTLFVVSVLVFVAIHLVPGSYSDVVLGQFATPESKAALDAAYGLDEPVPVQFFQWLRHVATGDLGTSLASGEPLTDQLARRLPVTAELTLMAAALTLLVGVPLGLAAGLARGAATRGVSRLSGAVAMSVPDFVLGSLLVYLFSRYALGLSVGVYVPFTENPIESIRAMLLPAITLSVFGIALMVRTMRDSITAVFSAPHVAAATARGETMSHIVRHHVLRNAAIPVVTVLAVYVGYLMGGAVIVENLFSLPGVGQMVLNGVSDRDYAVVQGVVLVAAAVFITINMLADAAYGVIDPRVRQ